MISEGRSLRVLLFPHVSEKSSYLMEKRGVVVFNVVVKCTKLDIKQAIEKLFSVNVYNVSTVNVKRKVKIRKGAKKSGIFRTKIRKKAYVTLGLNQKIDFLVKLNDKM